MRNALKALDLLQQAKDSNTPRDHLIDILKEVQVLSRQKNGLDRAEGILKEYAAKDPILEVFIHWTAINCKQGKYFEAVDRNIALMRANQDPHTAVVSCSMAISTLLEIGYQQKALNLLPELKSRIVALGESDLQLCKISKRRLHNVAMQLPYLVDDPAENRSLMKYLAWIIQR